MYIWGFGVAALDRGSRAKIQSSGQGWAGVVQLREEGLRMPAVRSEADGSLGSPRGCTHLLVVFRRAQGNALCILQVLSNSFAGGSPETCKQCLKSSMLIREHASFYIIHVYMYLFILKFSLESKPETRNDIQVGLQIAVRQCHSGGLQQCHGDCPARLAVHRFRV